jgi:hypothetical protein
MGTTITDESTIDYRYLMSKSKDDLVGMYLELHRQYREERERQTPRPTLGMKIVLDTSLSKNVCEVCDTQRPLLGKVAIEP